MGNEGGDFLGSASDMTGLQDGALDLDIEQYFPGGEGEQVFQGQQAFAAESGAKPDPGVQLLELTPGQAAHPTMPVCGPIHPGIMHHHDSAVTTALYITFEHIRSQIHGALKSGQGVLWAFPRGTTMGNYQHGKSTWRI